MFLEKFNDINHMDDFIEKLRLKSYISSEEEKYILITLHEYQDDNTFYKFKYDFIPKKMDECRRIFKTDKKTKYYLQYINFLIFKNIEENKEIIDIKSCNMIISDINKNNHNYKYIKKLDISKYFDTINREILLDILNKLLLSNKKEIFSALDKVFSEMDRVNQIILDENFNTESAKNISKIKIGVGIPQGLPISNLLSYIYLYDIKSKNELVYRYVDDIFILSNNKNNNLVSSLLKSTKKLYINKNKKEIIEIHTSNTQFNILGYNIKTNQEKDLSISPSIESLNRQYKKLRDFIRQAENPNKIRYIKYAVELQIVGYISKQDSFGWLNYFQSINDIECLFNLDKWIHKNMSKLNIQKKYIRAYHCIRNIKNEKNYRYLTKDTSKDEISIDDKREILSSFYDLDFKGKDESSIIEDFNYLHYKQIQEMEENFGRIS